MERRIVGRVRLVPISPSLKEEGGQAGMAIFDCE